MEIRILAFSGSLRAASSNTAMLEAAGRLAPPGVAVSLYEALGELPHFNADLESEVARLPRVVAELRARVAAADGMLISSPEYARGVPGSLKNALDWLVGEPAFADKPVALFNASPRSTHAQAALRLILETMSAHLVEPASITLSLLGRPLSGAEIAGSEALAMPLREALARFAAAIRARRTETSAGGSEPVRGPDRSADRPAQKR